ncbi:hypothetical protein IAR55_006890 [Kwoniella newhampshirensis]|uniref:Dystroglycan-type cadherin-like domain-containing protein n=1 Tax=Kwoniella newhampshirensis TaxID=1651941 RepID=A0AAW0YT01_9TREE
MLLYLPSTLFLWIVFAVPQVVLASTIGPITLILPLSQQSPPVARVKQAYSFTFSPSTFNTTSSASPLSYTAFNLPPWVSFSGGTRTFTGQPTEADVGSREVSITATSPDGQSSLTDHVTLFVSDKSGEIVLTNPLADQLVSSDSAITSAYPYPVNSPLFPGVRVPPNWSFSLGFLPSTFTAPTRVFYSASLADGSPLPDWLYFNNQTVTFDGVTPQSVSGTTYDLILSGSDVLGYADIHQSFKVIVAAHDLQVISQPVINMTIGYPVDLSIKDVVFGSLTVDGKANIKADDANFALDTSSVSWLTYTPSNMSVAGTPPSGQFTFSLPVTITGNYGDTAQTKLAINLFPSVFISDRPDSMILRVGHAFDLPIGQYLSNATTNAINTSATFSPKDTSAWLKYSASDMSLTGTPPEDTDYDSVTVHLQAQDLVTNVWSQTTLTLALMSNGTAASTHAHPHMHHGLSKGTTLAIALICSLVGMLALGFLLVTCSRRRKASRQAKALEEGLEKEEREAGKWSYEAAETPALEYTEKMGGDPATTQMLNAVMGMASTSDTTVVNSVPHLPTGITNATSVSTTTRVAKKSFLSNPFASKKNGRIPPKISNPIIMPSLSNAAFQAQLAAAVDSAGIVNRTGTAYSSRSGTSASGTMEDEDLDGEGDDFTASGSEVDRSRAGSKASQRSDLTGQTRRTTITEDSQFAGSGFSGSGQSSRASWESEPPFVWTSADTPRGSESVSEVGATGTSGGASTVGTPSEVTHETGTGTGTGTAFSSMRALDSNAPVQRADFRLVPSSRAPTPPGVDSSDDGMGEISIDNIHFPTDSDIAHTESSYTAGDDVIITTASRVDARRTLDSPAAASLASSHTERGAPSPVMTTHSRLVSFGRQRTVAVEQTGGIVSQSAVVEAGSVGLGIAVGASSTSVDGRAGAGGTPVTARSGTTVTPPPDNPSPQPPRAAFTRQQARPRAPVPLPPSRSATPPSSLPSLPALPTLPSTTSATSRKHRQPASGSRQQSPLASPQRILLGVSEPFHFYPPLSITPSTSSSSTSSSISGGAGKNRAREGAEYLAFVEEKEPGGKGMMKRLVELPDWLHFEDGELWGVPTEANRGEVDLRIVERRGDAERVVGRFALEVVGR